VTANDIRAGKKWKGLKWKIIWVEMLPTEMTSGRRDGAKAESCASLLKHP
jgi:hypothetical protein